MVRRNFGVEGLIGGDLNSSVLTYVDNNVTLAVLACDFLDLT